MTELNGQDETTSTNNGSKEVETTGAVLVENKEEKPAEEKEEKNGYETDIKEEEEGKGQIREAEQHKQRSKEFLQELQQFHDNVGTPFPRFPKINGKDIDLYQLYSEVTSRGGWIKVNQKDEWDEVLEAIDFPRSCVNASVGLKYVYIRYLDRYEKLNFLGEEVERIDEDDEEVRHKKLSARILHAVPMTYNYAQHMVSKANRVTYKLSTDYYKPSEYERLFMSLLSPLPNEQDFAINVCTLMANEKATLKVEKCPKLIDALLAHAGVFHHYSTRDMFKEFYSNIRQHSLQQFWNESLAEKPHIIELTYEDYLEVIEEKLIHTSDRVAELSGSDSNSTTENSMMASFLSLYRGLGSHDYVGQRVHQVTSILRNLTFVEENSILFARNPTFVRFLVMCANIRWNNLHHMALDMFGNIAPDIELADPITDNLSRCLLHTVIDGLESEDRGVIISCMEILYKLCRKVTNEDYLHKCFDKRLFEKITLYLCLNDIMLLLYTLECVYALTSLGEKTCNAIVHVRGVVDTLVSLVTVEAQSFGADGCILMRVVETIPGSLVSGTHVGAPQMQTTNSSQYQQQDPNKILISHQNMNSPSKTNVRSEPIITTVPGGQPQQQHSPRSPKITPVKSAAQVQQQSQAALLNKQTQQQILQENDQFAQAWIRATCEFSPNKTDRVEQQELYKLYVQASSKIGRRGIVTPIYFPKCVRAVFGVNAGPIQHDSVMYYDGVKLRPTPLAVVVQKSVIVNHMNIQQPLKPGSPVSQTIQKQIIVQKSPLPTTITERIVQRTTPPSTPMSSNVPIQQSPTVVKTTAVLPPPPPTTIMAPQTSVIVPSSSSLIKSLLANKVTTTTAPILMNPPTASVPQAIPSHQQQQPQQQPPVFINSNSVNVNTSSSTTRPNAVNPSVITSSATGQKFIAPPPARLNNNAGSHQSIVFTNPNNLQSVNNNPISSNASNVIVQQVAQRQQLQKQKEMAQKYEQNPTVITIPAQSSSQNDLNPVPPLAPLSSGSGLMLPTPRLTLMSAPANTVITTGPPRTSPKEHMFSAEDQLDGMTPPYDDDDSTEDDGSDPTQNGNKSSQVVVANKMLADLLDKKSHPPVFSADNPGSSSSSSSGSGTKRKSSTDEQQVGSEVPAKRATEDEGTKTTSSAANLYAEMAASILEDEDESMDEEEEDDNGEEEQPPTTIIIPAKTEPSKPPVITLPLRQQIIVSPNTHQQQQQQVILSQHQNFHQPTTTATIKTESGYQTVPILLQHSQSQSSNTSNTISTSGSGNMMQRQMQGGQTQYMLATNPQGQTYVVATQSPMQQQMQTLLLTQTPQQQGTNAKTIIILQQPQQSSNQTSQPTTATPIQQAINNQTQKMTIMTTQQGQQMVVTQRHHPHQIVLGSGSSQGGGNNSGSSSTQTTPNIIVQQNVPAPPQLVQKQLMISQQNQIVKPLISNENRDQGESIIVQQRGNLQIKQIQPPSVVQGQPAQIQITQKVINQPPQQTIKMQMPPSPSPSKIIVPNPAVLPPPPVTIQAPSAPIAPPQSQPPKPVANLVQTQNPVNQQSSSTPSLPNSPQPITNHPVVTPPPPEPPVSDNGVDINWLYVCDWRGCPRKKFKSANEVYMHACSAHCPDSLDLSADIYCQWGPAPNLCDNIPRKRFGLMTHFLDRHCTQESFKAAVQRRLTHGLQPASQGRPVTLIRAPQAAENSAGTASPALSTSSNLSNPPANAQSQRAGAAALQAITRHALDFTNPKELMDDNEGPVTKSIRLTAALVLRNLVNYSDVAKRMLRLHETHLAQIALSNVESSRTIAQVLFEMNDVHPV